MIETDAFLAAFTLQILTGSVLGPTGLIRGVQEKVSAFPNERFAEIFPGIDKAASARRFAMRFRLLNTGIALLGLILLAWFFNDVRQPNWNRGIVALLLTLYVLVQVSPLFLISAKSAKGAKLIRAAMADGKRKAVLQRRGLFDFVSPLVVALAVLSYLVFVALVLYIRQHPFPGFGGLSNIVIITGAYVFNALVVYLFLYGKNRNPLARPEDRLFAIGVVVKACIASCIAVTLFASLQLVLSLLNLRDWGLVAVSLFFVLCLILSYMSTLARPRSKDGSVGSGGPLPPPAQDLPV